jgi:hypothetical protein
MFAFWAPHARSKSAMGMWTKPGVLRRTNLLDDYRRSFDSLETVENLPVQIGALLTSSPHNCLKT